MFDYLSAVRIVVDVVPLGLAVLSRPNETAYMDGIGLLVQG